MKSEQIKNELIKYGDIIDAKGFSPGTSGNISVRYGDKIIITASGASNGDLAYEDLILIDFDGKVVEGKKKASSEKMLHVEFYKKRPDINAIIHVHPTFLSSFAAARKGLEEPVMAENVYYFGKIPLADYALPSSKELVEKTAEYFDKYNAVLMANHGFIVGDIDLEQAYLKLELAESYAQIVLNAKLLGGAILLSKKEVAQIEALKK
ncbi:MAG: class II aldolase/adducin family protein [Candidatus Gastranaerophilales bacterium]|nr:class II aldolase/adducin family protein [Candidatus Gastranaerophilales bacterium]